MPDQAPKGGARREPSPFRLNPEQLRKRAKELLAGLRAGVPEAAARLRARHPAAARRGEAPPEGWARLADAQLVIARENGLPSWPALMEHCARMERSWRRIAEDPTAPDAGPGTLHIRCGEDIAQTLREAGFAGDFLEYSDPVCQGPVPDTPDWIGRRAEFLFESYGAGTGRSHAAILEGLDRAEARLAAAAESHERVVLWFEHDSYDQLILARCLALFHARRPARLELISPGSYPGGTRFIGLGQLPPEALRLLWQERQEVSEAQLRLGRAVWDSLRRDDPVGLGEIAREGTPDLPQMGRAVHRHCREFPSVENGLGLTQQLILEILAEAGPMTVGQVYARLMREREPLPWLGDLMMHRIVEEMKGAAAPVFAARPAPEGGWAREELALTAPGAEVLVGRRDWMALAPPERWLGGVRIGGEGSVWRWEEGARRFVRG